MMTKTSAVVLLTSAAIGVFWACSSDNSNQVRDQNAAINETRKLEKQELIERGEYLITIAGCGDCHSPKVFNERGMFSDSARLYSGHRAEAGLPPVAATSLQPGNWAQMGPEITAFAGPWGISYAANLTPDSATGIGSWSEEIFIKTLRTGRHLGADNGRQILPPMPWPNLAKMNDEDFRAIYTYLRSLPPIENRVPAPLPPPAVKVAGKG